MSALRTDASPQLAHRAAPAEGVTVVYSGPLVKGLYDAIHAVQLARIRRVQARLVIDGDGPLAGELRYFSTALKVSDAVWFGPPLLDAADALLCIDPVDHVPAAVRRALDCGLRIIAPADCGLGRSLKEGVQAILLASPRPHLICEALVTLSRSRRLLPGLIERV